MENQNNFISTQIKKIKNGYVNIDPVKFIKTLKVFSQIIFVFSIIYIGTYFYMLFTIDVQTAQNFKLVLSNIDILPLYNSSFVTFVFIAAYEIIKMALIATTFFYFIKFLESMDINDPFKNIKSKDYLFLVAIISSVFFSVDAISMMHLAYFQNDLPIEGNLRIFHFEYLFLAYFLNVFAVIFKRGVDLNNEIDLVI